jgi:hypothetical protein
MPNGVPRLWKKTLLALLVPLLLGGASVGVYLIAAAFDRGQVDGEFRCAPEDLKSAEVSARFTISAPSGDYVRHTTRVELSLPVEHELSWALLDHRDDPNFRAVVRCLLGANYDDLRAKEPEITLADGRVRLIDEVYRDTTNLSTTTVGVVALEALGTTRWKVSLRIPEALTQAKWSGFTVVTPKGWQAQWLGVAPTSRIDTEVVWAGPVDEVGLLVVPDFGVMLAYSDNRLPYSVMSAVLYWAPQVVAVLLLLVAMRRAPATAGPSARQAGVRMSVLALAVLAYNIADDVATAVFSEQATVSWSILALASAVVGVCVAAAFALFSRAGVVAAAFAVLALALIGWLALGTAAGVGGLTMDAPPRLAVKTAAALVLTTLVSAAAVQAVRWVCRPDSTRWPGPVPWLLGAVFAVVLTYDKLLGDVISQIRGSYLTAEPVTSVNLCCTYEYFPDALLTDVGWLAPLLPAIALAVLLLRSLDQTTPDRRWAGWACGALLFAVVLPWGAYLWGWRVPVWVLWAVVCLVVLPRIRSPLDRKAGTQTVREFVARLSDDELRGCALAWPLDVQRERAEEDAYTKGGPERGVVDREGVLKRVTDRLRRRKAPSARQDFPVAGLTPVDVLLALGPGGTTRGNVRVAVRTVLWTGLPVGLGIVVWRWLELDVSQLRPTWYLEPLVYAALNEVAKWLFTGLVVGALWQQLPGRRGPLRIAPVAGVFVLAQLGIVGPTGVTGHPGSGDALIDVTTYIAVLTSIGLAMDVSVLRGLRTTWARPWQAFRQAYGMQNIGGQLTFLLAQMAAVLAIMAYLHGSPEPPAYPSVDPFQFNRPTAP